MNISYYDDNCVYYEQIFCDTRDMKCEDSVEVLISLRFIFFLFKVGYLDF